MPAPDLAAGLRARLIGVVRRTFNDQEKGEKPVQRSDGALFPRGSVTWRVHGDVTTMMVGGVASLLLQMLHPAVLAGVWDHSAFRKDMLGRLRRTARFIAETTYAERGIAEASIARVREVHERVAGALPDGTPYRADDPELLAWVHVTEMWSFLAAWQRYGVPITRAEEDIYYAETARTAEALGADPIPRSKAEAEALIAAMRPQLAVDARTREVARFVLDHPAPSLAVAPAQAAIFAAAVDLLPDWARAMHGLKRPPAAPLVRGSTLAIAKTFRWAFG
ncbi:oxygenase MpaB family protein [Sphingomonas sp.]|uniref:oxygenase MpaB family protein n=1 Tax=Sphingomonas sp. TaxID=28214 RepID=UPI002EDA68A5